MTGDKIDFGHGAIEPTSSIAVLLMTGVLHKEERFISIESTERVDEFTDDDLNPHYNVKFNSNGSTFNATGTLRQCCEAAFSAFDF